MIDIISYYRYKRANVFVKALACLPSTLRFKRSRELWMGLRLGLHKTILNERALISNRRERGVRLIAEVKRCEYLECKLSEQLEDYLLDEKNTFFHEELVRETVYLMQDFYIGFFSKNFRIYEHKFFLVRYLALLSHRNIDFSLKNFPKKILDYIRDKEPLLYSNIAHLEVNDKLNVLNKELKLYGLEPIELRSTSQGFCIQNFHCHIEPSNIYHISNSQPKVTILVTVFNTGSILLTSIESLLNQTWRNIEVIIINDASEDESLSLIKSIASHDKRVVIIDLPRNVGTFAAKSIGAKFATGELLTCHDSDDWAHPQKIEMQARELMIDKNIIATTSQWVRVDINGNYHVRQIYPYIRQNPASPLFRKEPVMQDTGLWHSVRTGADSEFVERLKVVYGKNRIKSVKKILTLGSYRENSLTTSKIYGAYNSEAALVRLDYWEGWRLWHLHCLERNVDLFMPSIDEVNDENRPDIAVPKSILVNKDDYMFNINNIKI